MFPVKRKLLLLFIRDKIKSLKELQKNLFIKLETRIHLDSRHDLSREFSRESDSPIRFGFDSLKGYLNNCVINYGSGCC